MCMCKVLMATVIGGIMFYLSMLPCALHVCVAMCCHVLPITVVFTKTELIKRNQQDSVFNRLHCLAAKCTMCL